MCCHKPQLLWYDIRYKFQINPPVTSKNQPFPVYECICSDVKHLQCLSQLGMLQILQDKRFAFP